MRKKVVISLFLIIFIFSMLFPLKAFCTGHIDEIINGMKNTGEGDLTADSKIVEGLNAVFSTIRYVGSGLSIVVVMMLAIKYMVASAAEKAEIKKQAIPVTIGCVIIFATLNIVSIISKIVNDI